MKLLKLLRAILSPTRDIARELKRLADLYELDLAARDIRPLRETPVKSDLEVSYTGDDPKKSRVKWLSREEQAELEDEE